MAQEAFKKSRMLDVDVTESLKNKAVLLLTELQIDRPTLLNRVAASWLKKVIVTHFHFSHRRKQMRRLGVDQGRPSDAVFEGIHASGRGSQGRLQVGRGSTQVEAESARQRRRFRRRTLRRMRSRRHQVGTKNVPLEALIVSYCLLFFHCLMLSYILCYIVLHCLSSSIIFLSYLTLPIIALHGVSSSFIVLYVLSFIVFHSYIVFYSFIAFHCLTLLFIVFHCFSLPLIIFNRLSVSIPDDPIHRGSG